MAPQHLLVVDIETVPDEAHHEGDGFPKPPFHTVVAIGFLHAVIDRTGDGVAYDLQELRCGGEASYSEAKLLQAFFQFFERHRPRLVTYNGRSFDLPVLKYRAMVHGVPSPSLHNRDYGYRYNIDWHCDLLDVLSDFGASTRVKLDEVCKVLGLPGKLGIDGSQVAGMYEAGRIEDIRNYCETDVLNTYLVFLRYELQAGRLTLESHNKAVSEVIAYIDAEKEGRPHLVEFVLAWGEASGNQFLLPESAPT